MSPISCVPPTFHKSKEKSKYKETQGVGGKGRKQGGAYKERDSSSWWEEKESGNKEGKFEICGTAERSLEVRRAVEEAGLMKWNSPG